MTRLQYALDEDGCPRELLVGAYERDSGAHVRVIRVDGTRVYRAYVDGWLEVEGSRAACMRVARSNYARTRA